MLHEQEDGSVSPSSNGSNRSDERLPHQQWQGKSTQFMRSNEHRKERAGVWNAEGLEGPALALVKGDEESGRCASVAFLFMQAHLSRTSDLHTTKPDSEIVHSLYVRRPFQSSLSELLAFTLFFLSLCSQSQYNTVISASAQDFCQQAPPDALTHQQPCQLLP